MSEERRTQTLRRQFNEAFCAPDGTFSISKALAVSGQASALWHFNTQFEKLMLNWDALIVILGIVVFPDVVKKLLALKYGGSEK